jgi:phthalate 4,5-dioxygenase oxygenase subunit
MMTKEDNELLTRVGPGTPMGTLLRRFWLPALLAAEVEKPDSTPVRIRILCEDLVAFRDTSGRVGIVDAYCAHRRAPLFFGRNEECGLRCPYHGWKFDVDGKCLDIPNVVSARDMTAMKSKLGITAYPTREAGGVIWVYMGPSDKVPDFPHLQWTTLPKESLHVSRWIQRSNWMQGVEGEIDTSHISFLHKDFSTASEKMLPGVHIASDGAPEITLRETEYGFTYGARRKLGDQSYWRQTQWLLPMHSMIPRTPEQAFTHGSGRAWVPIDDNHTTTFSYGFRSDGPLNVQDIETLESGYVFPPRLGKGTFVLPDGYKIDTYLPMANKDNDYLIDRDKQRTINFTGIWGANEQDRSLQESMQGAGPETPGIVDRSREHLVASDVAIVTARRRLLKMARDLQNGIEPPPAANGEMYGVRAFSCLTSISEFDELQKEYGHHTLVKAKG